MRNRIVGNRRFVLLVVLLAGSFIRSGVAQNLLITDYRVPVSSAQALRVNLQYDYKRSGSEEVSNRGNFFADYRYFYDSLRFAYTVDARASVDKSDADSTYAMNGEETVKAYLFRDFFVGSDFRREFTKEKGGDAHAGASLGVGRFINVTPLAKAVRIEDWLLELNELQDDLPAETMIELAQVIQKEGEFRERFGDTYKQEWIEEMTRVIRASGMMLHTQLDAVALLRMDEVLTQERVFDRFYGWELRAGASIPVFGAERLDTSGGKQANATVQYSLPLGWRTQWNERATITSPIGDDFSDAYDVTVQSDLSYEIGNRVDFLLSHVLTAQRARPLLRVPGQNAPLPSFERDMSHRVQSSLIYFVESELTLSLNGVLNANEGRLHRAVTLTFGYRFF